MSKKSQKKTRRFYHARTEYEDPAIHPLYCCPASPSYDGTKRSDWEIFRYNLLSALNMRSNWRAHPTGARLHLTFMSAFAGPVLDYYLAVYHNEDITKREFISHSELLEAANAVLDDVVEIFGETKAEIKRRYEKEYLAFSQGNTTTWWEFYLRFIHLAKGSGLISASPGIPETNPHPVLFADLKRKTRRELLDRLDTIIEPIPKPLTEAKGNISSHSPARKCPCFSVLCYDGGDRSEWIRFRAKVTTILQVDWKVYAEVDRFSGFLACTFEGYGLECYDFCRDSVQITEEIFVEWPQLEKAANNILDTVERMWISHAAERGKYEEEYSTMWQQSMDWSTFYSKFILAAFKSGRISALPTPQQPNRFLFLDLKSKTKRKLVDRVYTRHGLDVNWDNFVASCREFDPITR